MLPFELAYVNLVQEILLSGEKRTTRNGTTYSVFGRSLTADLTDGFPLLNGRQIFYKGVFGELAAMLRQPTCVADFERWGCNYWKAWADSDGELSLDYGNAWFNWNGVNQIAELKIALKHNPTSRRMIINSWRPDRLRHLSLPCCHYSYQFYVGKDSTLHMVWTQRSVDVMVGLPSDMVFAAAWLIAIANEFCLTPGTIKMDFGDCHVYEEHCSGAIDYVDAAIYTAESAVPVRYKYARGLGADFTHFTPDDLKIYNYNPGPAIKFLLKE